MHHIILLYIHKLTKKKKKKIHDNRIRNIQQLTICTITKCTRHLQQQNINKHSFALLLHTYYNKTLLVASIPAYCNATKLKEP